MQGERARKHTLAKPCLVLELMQGEVRGSAVDKFAEGDGTCGCGQRLVETTHSVTATEIIEQNRTHLTPAINKS